MAELAGEANERAQSAILVDVDCAQQEAGGDEPRFVGSLINIMALSQNDYKLQGRILRNVSHFGAPKT